MTTAKRTSPYRPDRLVLIGDTAIRLLVERGMRGLTHRAVDESAGLPPGSTSYYARTRAALLEVALARMTVLEAGEFAPALADGESPPALPGDPAGVADLVAEIVDAAIRDGRDQKIARYELALEATRRPELRTVYDEAGAVFRGAAAAMLAALGSPAPERHGRFLVAWCEGVMFDAIAGAGWATPPSRADIRVGVTELLAGMLVGAAPSAPGPLDGKAPMSDMNDSPDRS
ncbi:TetR/AcrR family transcriptional regulator [Embleya sp. NPDC008237]|uniref:TetR/AcrR family transcriptional regulator n=1 Tax=Embleya sp. NPDC008237 TaxID=3363978 RepID=UPI0036E03763